MSHGWQKLNTDTMDPIILLSILFASLLMFAFAAVLVQPIEGVKLVTSPPDDGNICHRHPPYVHKDEYHNNGKKFLQT